MTVIDCAGARVRWGSSARSDRGSPPRCGEVIRVLRDLRATGVREVECGIATVSGRDDEVFVHELLESGSDGSGAWPPRPHRSFRRWP